MNFSKERRHGGQELAITRRFYFSRGHSSPILMTYTERKEAGDLFLAVINSGNVRSVTKYRGLKATPNPSNSKAQILTVKSGSRNSPSR